MQSQYLVNLALILGKVGLTGLSGAANTFSTGKQVDYSLGSKAYTKAAVAGAATPTTDAITGKVFSLAAGKGTVMLWCFDATGAIKVVQGSTESVDDYGNFLAAPNFPSIGDDLAPFAYSLHKNTSNFGANVTPFVFGTGLWNQANTIHTVQDILALPARPQTV